MAKTYIIYKYTSPSGKSYIGQTCNFKLRRNKHKTSNCCTAFAAARDKYGFDNFIEEILEENLTLDEANEKESYWISFYNTMSPNGYNLQSGGSNYIMSDETKRKLSILNTGENSPMFGKHISETHKQKLKELHIGENNPMYGRFGELHPNFGKTPSDKTKQRMSENHANVSGENNPMHGKKLSEDAKEKIRKTHIKKWIIIFPDEHEELIENLREFCRSKNLNAACMVRVAKHQRKQHKGFKCSYYIVEESL